MQVFIETERLLLRRIVETDAQDLFELDSDPEVYRYLGDQSVKTIEESEAVIQFIRKQYKENGIGRLAVIDKQTNEFLGWSGLKYETEVRKDLPYYDLGYRFKPQYWGKGIATESALASLRYGFLTLKLNEICAAADLDNIGSNVVLKKAGLSFVETFECDNVLHNWYKIEKSTWLEKQT